MAFGVRLVKGVTFVFALVFLAACEPETFEEKERDSDSDTSIFLKKLTLKELQQKHSVMEKLEAVKTDFQKGNSISGSDYGFTVDTDEVVYIENGEQHSYTFLIGRDDPVSEVENLVLDYDKGQYKAYLVIYEATPDELAATQGQVHRVKISALSDFDLLFTNRKRPKPCVTVIKKAVAWNEQGQVTHSEWIEVIDQDCVNQSTGGGQSNNSSSSGGHGSSSGGVSNGGWGGWMGTGFNTGVYGPPQGGSYDGYTGGNTIGHFGASGSSFGNQGASSGGSFTTDFSIGVTNPLPTINNYGNSGGHSVLTQPVFNLKFGLYLKNFKNSMKTIVPNHLWWRSTTGKGIIRYLKEHFDNQTGTMDTETSEFAVWAVQYLVSHPEVTWEQFENCFLGAVEGKDYFYDADYWGDPNLNFPPQNLPSFTMYLSSFPKIGNDFIKGADNIYGIVGGAVWQARLDYPEVTENTCALRVSIALTKCNVVIPNIPGQTIEGGGDFEGKYFFVNARALNSWMRKTFGTTTGEGNTPYNPKHEFFSAEQGGLHGQNFPILLKNKRGIYSLITLANSAGTVSGHADVFNGYGNEKKICSNGCYFNTLPVERIDIWILD